MFTDREIFLMSTAFDARSYYSSLSEWLNTGITEFGDTVCDSLSHYADIKFPESQVSPEVK